MAYTRLKFREAPKIAKFLLRNQEPDGWWPIFPAQPRDSNASTYATAMVTLALANYIATNALEPNEKDHFQKAVDAGVLWLRRRRIQDQARWKDYPNAADGQESLSLSAMALHVLHKLDRNYDSSISDAWLKKLPEVPTSVLPSEMRRIPFS
jgi:hypothetical protein